MGATLIADPHEGVSLPDLSQFTPDINRDIAVELEGPTNGRLVSSFNASAPHCAILFAKCWTLKPPHRIKDRASTSICSVSSVYWPALSFSPGHPSGALP